MRCGWTFAEAMDHSFEQLKLASEACGMNAAEAALLQLHCTYAATAATVDARAGGRAFKQLETELRNRSCPA